MGAALGGVLLASAVFLGSAGLRRYFGLGATAATGLALLTITILGIGGLLLAIKLGY